MSRTNMLNAIREHRFVALAAAIVVGLSGKAFAADAIYANAFETGPTGGIENVVLETSPDQLPGRLYVPDMPNGAVVVLMHGCTGMWQNQTPGTVAQTAIEKWGAQLARTGYLALAVDSYTSRRPAGADPMAWQTQCAGTRYAGAVDAYATRPDDIDEAIAWLRYHVGSMAARVAVLGWSQGAEATLIRSAETSREADVSLYRNEVDEARALKASVVFYPGCGLSLGFAANPHLGSSFWRPHHDLRFNVADLDSLEADCETRATIAQTNYDALQGTTHAVSLTPYPGARHSFDTSIADWPEAPCGTGEPGSDECAARAADLDSYAFLVERLSR